MDVNIGVEFLDLDRVCASQAIRNNGSLISTERSVDTFKSSNHSISDQLLDQVKRDFLENNIFEYHERGITGVTNNSSLIKLSKSKESLSDSSFQ